jgi:SLA1 homology domain 1, SHD1
MFTTTLRTICFIGLCCALSTANAREWSTPGGHYKLNAEAVAFNDTTVVLKKTNGQLVAVELAELSEADQEYVKSKEAKETYAAAVDKMQTWTAPDGLKIRAKVLAYGRKDLVVNRQLGKVYVNGTRFSSYDQLHQKLILRILSKLENQSFADEHSIETWAKQLGGTAKTYPLEGVLMQLESGDEIGVPFFLFSEEEQQLLEPGWKMWLEDEASAEAQKRESLLVQAQAMEYQRDRQRQQQIESMKLDLLATATGLISIWEVILRPAQGIYGRQTSVFVPAANSEIAEQTALQSNPGYQVIGIRRASN